METPKTGPKTANEALAAAKLAHATPEDEALLESDSSLVPEVPEVPESPEIPDWLELPPNTVLPSGRNVTFIRFRSRWTDTPGKGDRTCVIWNLSVQDEKIAVNRANTQNTSVVRELSKQTIRYIDGKKVDWTTGVHSKIERFWDEIGFACREKIAGLYSKNHSLTMEDEKDFFEHCICVKPGG